ncbi:hypothetical protein J2D69_08215 [Lysinibacillus sphaericus]|nr:hypothetical protein [Bacillus thuringiensis]MBI6864147.1 hypothetical protein [Lysinibacillus fusiformis]QIC49893.1 hypothetical protein GAG94_20200 [Lysinibacillus sphaericus]QPA52118.1 hypothetical protein INQ54_07515 [Lysinibacillus sphaericus]QPA56615.1 hypothetical protein INQ53_07550 [Lysinibacillus sphaericus]
MTFLGGNALFKNFREELKKEWKNTTEDLEKEVFKVWQLEYKGHIIRIVNAVTEEVLYINNEVVDKKSRDSMFKQVYPFVKLKGEITETNGTVSTVKVKIGGLLSLNIVVKVNGTILLHEKHKISID